MGAGGQDAEGGHAVPTRRGSAGPTATVWGTATLGPRSLALCPSRGLRGRGGAGSLRLQNGSCRSAAVRHSAALAPTQPTVPSPTLRPAPSPQGAGPRPPHVSTAPGTSVQGTPLLLPPQVTFPTPSPVIPPFSHGTVSSPLSQLALHPQLAPNQCRQDLPSSHLVPRSPSLGTLHPPLPLASHPSSLGADHVPGLRQMLGGGRSVISSQTSKSLH